MVDWPVIGSTGNLALTVGPRFPFTMRKQNLNLFPPLSYMDSCDGTLSRAAKVFFSFHLWQTFPAEGCYDLVPVRRVVHLPLLENGR
jgi:hypothetical protein